MDADMALPAGSFHDCGQRGTFGLPDQVQNPGRLVTGDGPKRPHIAALPASRFWPSQLKDIFFA